VITRIKATKKTSQILRFHISVEKKGIPRFIYSEVDLIEIQFGGGGGIKIVKCVIRVTGNTRFDARFTP
jgi:hypothetical protein